nr:unnamed protein product [Callosobruchus analis]
MIINNDQLGELTSRFTNQTVIGDLAGISQPAVSVTIQRVSEVLAEHVATHIKYPQSWFESQLNIQKFHLISNFPELSGCIDGTDISTN